MGEKIIFHDWHKAYSPEFERTEKLKGTTPLQREWVKRAWDTVFDVPEGYHVCGFPIIKDEGFYLHGFVKKIQVHHLVNRGYASHVLGLSQREINNPLNLIPLCDIHHRGNGLKELDYRNEVVPAVHPDLEVARQGYTGSKHPSSYDFAFRNRQEMMKRGEEYHNPDFDQALLAKIEEVYYRYLQIQMELRGEYFDPFPYRK